MFYTCVNLRIFCCTRGDQPGKEKLADGTDTGKGKVMFDTVMRNWRNEIR